MEYNLSDNISIESNITLDDSYDFKLDLNDIVQSNCKIERYNILRDILDEQVSGLVMAFPEEFKPRENYSYFKMKDEKKWFLFRIKYGV